MSSEGETYEEAWKRLRKGQHEAQGISVPTVASDVITVDGAVRYALGSRGEARLLVPIGMHERLKLFGDSPALRGSDATLQQDGKPARFIDLTCLVSELDSVFAEVTEELLKRIRVGTPAQSAVRSTLHDFRALLLRSPAKEVSDSEIIGLVGELVMLCRLLRLNSDSTEAWRGPAGERHDFRRGGVSLEVKTTGRPSDYSVSISAIDQLDAPNGGVLHLVHIILERDANGPHSVGRLAAAAASLTSDPNTVLEILSLLGCSDPDSESWNRLSFAEHSIDFYEVRAGFPRISSASFKDGALPDGVTKIEYTIDLSQAAEFALDSEEELDVQKRIAG